MITEAKFNTFSEKDRMNRTLEGIAYWAHVQAPKHSDKYKSDTFQINLGLDEAGIARAESYGLEVKPADKWNDMPHVVIQRKVRPGKTIAETKPDVVDSMQNPSSELIGNGSNVIVKFGTYFFGDKVRTTLFKVQIRKLVKYEGASGGLVKDPSGYVAGQATGTDGFDD